MALRNAFGDIALEATQLQLLSELQSQQKDALTRAELDSAPVVVDTNLVQPTTPLDTQPVSAVELPLPIGAATEAKQLPDNHNVQVSNFPSEYPLPLAQVTELTPQKNALTDAELRASPVEVTGNLTITPPALQQVADDYNTGEILPDQTGAGGVLTFTFTSPVQNIWIYAVNPLALDDLGEVRVDPFGGNPTSTFGIPVSFGGITPIPVVATTIKVFAQVGVRVTVYGNRR